MSKLRFFDFFILFLTGALTVFCAVRVYGKNSAETKLVIKNDGEEWVYSLDRAVTVDIPGPLGNTVVELRDRRARVVSSPCVNQTCIASGSIHRRGQWIACLPNGIFVSVEGAENSGAPGNSPPADGEGTAVDAASW
ncbi:MAG: NusG domain II-containing protein [Treponema sp.]|nr:NusG domain II-containing protein [Treponema sp.]